MVKSENLEESKKLEHVFVSVPLWLLCISRTSLGQGTEHLHVLLCRGYHAFWAQ